MSSPPDLFKDPPPRRKASLALATCDGLIVVIRRTYWGPISEWGLPGGSAAANTTARDALTLALHDKLGWRVTPGRLLAADDAPGTERAPEGTNWVYHVAVEPGTPTTPAGGYAELRWVSPEEACALAVNHERLRIEGCVRALAGGRFRELLLGIPTTYPDYPAALMARDGG
ncbi:NUDIX domain-containing protein [Kitasatospora sp. NPDC057198]|uniref:NUDIX domain-containing protein n=1 Tax=Kitasatospora sp. NPDC057198 TaxID=3346046 RepID=UPI0036273C9F